MIIEIGSFKFCGFYESMFSNSDEFIDDEYEIKDELVGIMGDNLKNDDDVVVECDYGEFKEYEKDVCKEFMKNYVDKINDVLPYWITENEFFKFEIVDKEDNIVVISPQYYNYERDRCYCDIETNVETLNLIKWYTLNLKGAKEYIINHFTSCDGFISFITNDYNEWKFLRITNYKQNMLIALLDMLITLSDESNFESIHYETYENIEKWCYVETKVIYKNRKYGLTEFRKKIDDGEI